MLEIPSTIFPTAFNFDEGKGLIIGYSDILKMSVDPTVSWFTGTFFNPEDVNQPIWTIHTTNSENWLSEISDLQRLKDFMYIAAPASGIFNVKVYWERDLYESDLQDK